jgi:hypothetical protein
MKICRVVFSTNRLEFLVPTLYSHQQNIDFGDHEVYSILIDDYPNNRHDMALADLVKKFDFDEIILHPENKGLTVVWSELWSYLSSQNFDYIWHHEDDIIFKQTIKIDDMVKFLDKNPSICQVTLKRNPWYEHEFKEPILLPTDSFFDNYRYNLKTDYFWTMASLYPHWITKEPIKKELGCNLGEQPVMKYFKDKYSMNMVILKNLDGSHLVEHIGVYSQGTRVLENEPGWEKFKDFDPDVRYDSKTGKRF